MQLSRLNQINLSIHLHLSVFAKLKEKKKKELDWSPRNSFIHHKEILDWVSTVHHFEPLHSQLTPNWYCL